jgi:hypothetical protein
MKKWALLSLVLATLGLYVSSTRSEASRSSADPVPTLESSARTDTAGDIPQHDPFTPFDPGPAEALVPYKSLTPAEQAVVDRGRNTAALATSLPIYASAAAELAETAAAKAATNQLGSGPLGRGVIQ